MGSEFLNVWDGSRPVFNEGWASWELWEMSNSEDVSAVGAVVFHSLEFGWAAHLVAWLAHTTALNVSSGKDGIGDSEMEALSAADLESFKLVGWEHVWDFDWSILSFDDSEWFMWLSLVGDGL